MVRREWSSEDLEMHKPIWKKNSLDTNSSFTNFYLSFSIAKESARVNGAISSVFLGVCRTKRLSNAQTTHFFTRSWEPSKNSYLTILIYMTQKKEEKKVGKRQVYIVAKVHLMKSWGGPIFERESEIWAGLGRLGSLEFMNFL